MRSSGHSDVGGWGTTIWEICIDDTFRPHGRICRQVLKETSGSGSTLRRRPERLKVSWGEGGLASNILKSILRSSSFTLPLDAEDEELSKAIQHQQHHLRRVKRREKLFAGNKNVQRTFLAWNWDTPEKLHTDSAQFETGPIITEGAGSEGPCIWERERRVGISVTLMLESGESRGKSPVKGTQKRSFSVLLKITEITPLHQNLVRTELTSGTSTEGIEYREPASEVS